MQGAQVQSLVGELRSQCHVAQPKKKKKFLFLNHMWTLEGLTSVSPQITHDYQLFTVSVFTLVLPSFSLDPALLSLEHILP